MSNIEIFYICLSVFETVVCIVLHRKMKKKLDEERKKCENKRIEYERLIEALPIGRNLL